MTSGRHHDPYLQLSPHFRLFEFTRSRVARGRGIDNQIREDHIVFNLRALCQKVLEPVRSLAGCPVRITSGYRSPALNRAVGGADESQHLFGQAADFTLQGGDLIALAQALQAHIDLPFDQCILEERERAHSGTLGRWSRWIHISHAPHTEGRREIFTKSVTLAGRRHEWGIHASPDESDRGE